MSIHPLIAIAPPPTPTIPFRLPPLAGLRRYSISIHSLPAAEAILLKKLFNSSNCYWSMEIFPHSFSYLPREMGISVKASILASGVQPWLVQNQSSSCRTSIADMIELLIVLNYIGCQEVTTDNATIA